MEQNGLRPVLVYTLVLPPYDQYWRRLVDPNQPVSLSSFLAEAWGDPRGFGMPMTVEAKNDLVKLDGGFVEWIKSQGVDVRLPQNPKQFSGREVEASRVWHPASLFRTRVDGVEGMHLRNECLSLHREFEDVAFMSRNSSKFALAYGAFSSRERRLCSSPSMENDWQVSEFPAYKPSKQPDPNLTGMEDEWIHSPVFVAAAGPIIRQWPGGKSAALKKLGIKCSDFDFWTSGRARLKPGQVELLAELLNADISKGSDFGRRYCDLRGGLLLIGKSKRDLRDAYEDLSHGGDVRAAFEILGPEGQTAELRFLYVEPWGGGANIILFKPDLHIELVHQHFINIQAPVRVPSVIWKDVELIVKGAWDSEDPKTLATYFGATYGAWLRAHSHDV
jgi:hypothetical protein